MKHGEYDPQIPHASNPFVMVKRNWSLKHPIVFNIQQLTPTQVTDALNGGGPTNDPYKLSYMRYRCVCHSRTKIIILNIE